LEAVEGSAALEVLHELLRKMLGILQRMLERVL
jgi:hypothetical protein